MRESGESMGFFRRIWDRFKKYLLHRNDLGRQYEEPRGVGIRIENLRKSFGDTEVLKDINLEIEPGETFCIIGPSGTGKSVLLKHIVKLLEPDSGKIYIDGEDIFAEKAKKPEKGNKAEQRGYRYSMVFQTSALFNSMSVGENVGLWLREKRVFPEPRIRRIIREKLRLVGLAGTENMKTSELSGGMKKRVAIARSLAMNPDLILYDEPTAELDPVTADELAKVINNLKTAVNLTTVIVSHDLNFALYLADRVAMIHQGAIVEVGTPEEIKKSDNQIVKNFIFTTTKGITKGE